jgi:transposase
MVAADARTAVTFSLSPGQAGDAPEGRKLLKTLENSGWEGTHDIKDKAYEGDESTDWYWNLKCSRSCRPNSIVLSAWDYSKAMYKKRNEVERLFRRLKGFHHIFSRFDKLDCVFMFFIHFALITDAIISVNTP